MSIKNYSELIKFDSFADRFKYLQLNGYVGEDTFGFDRYVNQDFYRSVKWKRVRDYVITRDLGRDLGVEGFEIFDRPIVHHMNPITLDDLTNLSDLVIDPEFLITVSHKTHNDIHYGNCPYTDKLPKERLPGDTCLWRR